MAGKDKITQKDVIESGVVEEFKDLNKQLSISVKLMAELSKNAVDLRKSFDAKNIQEVVKSQKEYNKVNEESQKQTKETVTTLEKLEKQIKEVNVEEERAKIALQKKRKEIKETIKAEKAQAGSINDLNRKNKILRERIKNVSTETEKGRKRITAYNKAIEKNEKRITKASDAFTKQKRNIGNYTQILDKAKAGFAAFAGVLAGGRVIIKGVGNLIASTQTSGDAFAITIEQAKIAYSAFNKAIASAELGDLITNFKEVLKVGKEYAILLDDLGDRNRGLKLAEAEARIETEKLKQVVDNINLSNEERIKAAERVLEIERSLLGKRQSIRDQAFTAEAKRLEVLTGLNRDQVISFIKNYDDEKTIREDAIAFIKEEDALRKKISDNQLAVNTSFAQGNTQLAESFQNTGTELENQSLLLQQNVDESVKAYSLLFRSYSKTTDEELDKITETYKAFLDSQSEFYTGTRRAATQYNTILKQINKSNEKAIETEKEKAEVTKTTGDETLSFIEEQNEKERELLDEKLTDEIDLILSKEEEKVMSLDELRQQDLAKEEESQKKKGEGWRFYVDFAIGQASKLSNSIFGFLDAQADAQLNADIEKARSRGASEKEIEKIEKDAAKKRQQRQIIEATINTALAVTSALTTQPFFPLGLIMAVVAAAAGAIEIASISSQSFAKGTKDSGSSGMIAEVGERGTERINYADGSSALTPNGSTYTYLPPHSEVVPNHRLQQDLAEMQIAGRSVNKTGDVKHNQNQKELLNAIKSRPRSIINITEGGFYVTAEKGASRVRYITRKYRK